MAYAEGFTALADPTRWHIFEALRERPQTFGQLAAGQAVTPAGRVPAPESPCVREVGHRQAPRKSSALSDQARRVG